jgi:hypothetical protein
MIKRISSFILYLCLIAAALTMSCSNLTRTDILKEGFVNPPDSARPGVFWYIMDGNLDRKAITADLESMKEAGIGYVLFTEVNVGIPRGKVDFLSDQWQELFTHAVRECERLGIELILASGPGWSGSGGPWITPEKSMMHIVAYDTIITGPLVFEGKLPIPGPREPFFGENFLTEELKKSRDSWYRDVRILAFPADENPEQISNIDEKALFYRAHYTSQPGVASFIPVQSQYGKSANTPVNKDKISDINFNMKPDGTLQWIVPPGRWHVIRFGIRNNGSVTMQAPAPVAGFESNKFDTAALKVHYDAYIGKLISKVKPGKTGTGGGWTMVHIDCRQMGAQNWSNRFIEEFIKRRGYDPLLYLPVFKGYAVNSVEESERFLWDVRQTSNELIVQNYAEYFRKLAGKSGLSVSIEPCGMNPASDLDLGAAADVPAGEFWTDGFGSGSSFSCIEAASIGHVTGKPIIAAEAFKSSSEEGLKLYPGNMKNQTDWALAAGMNRLFFHAFTHKSPGDQYLPGITMGPYGVIWDRGQTWWPMVKDYHKYVARCQYVLSQGKPVSDILYLAPEGAPQVFRPPSSALEGTDNLPDKRGYSFDACSPKYLIEHATVNRGIISFPGGASYRLLVLPDVPFMTPELINKIEQMLRLGASIAGYQPKKSPSLENYPFADATIKDISDRMWRINQPELDHSMLRYMSGTIYQVPGSNALKGSPAFELYPDYDSTVNRVLKKMGIKEDFISSGNIRYNHRTTAEREIYFISSRSDSLIYDTCIFRDGTLKAELWDPVTSEIRPLNNLSKDNNGIKLKVRMEPYQSFFIVFYRKDDVHSGYSNRSNFPTGHLVHELKNHWSVSFDRERGGPGNVIFDSLSDWSKREEEGIRYYSGTATYSCNFDLPDSVDVRSKGLFLLDAGALNNVARIRLNGEDLGIIWTYPHTKSISGVLKQKDNHLEIEVVNLWVNRLIGDELKPWDGIENGKWPDWLLNNQPRTSGRFTFTTQRFCKKDDPLMASGLTGPVRIMVSE